MNDAGLICIAAFVAPSDAVRQRAREVIGADRFLTVHVATPLAACRDRDQEQAYAKADAGEIANFPGVSAAYEEPTQPDLVVRPDQVSIIRVCRTDHGTADQSTGDSIGSRGGTGGAV